MPKLPQPPKNDSKTDAPESPRNQRPRKYTKTERSHAENQERAYIAASRRSDRSLEARLESARRASEIHKNRTGKGFRITEKAVMNEEMYEEEDPNYDRIVNSLVHSYNMPSIQTQFGGPMPLQRGGSISHISPMSPHVQQFPSSPMFSQSHQQHQSSLPQETELFHKQQQAINESYKVHQGARQGYMQQLLLQQQQQLQQSGNTIHPEQLNQMMGFNNRSRGSFQMQNLQLPQGLYYNPQTATFHPGTTAYNNSPLPSPHPQGSNSNPTTPMQQHPQAHYQQSHPSPHDVHDSPLAERRSPRHIHVSPYQHRQSLNSGYLDLSGSVTPSPLTVSTPTTETQQPMTPQPLPTSQPFYNDAHFDNKIVSGMSMLKQPYMPLEEQTPESTVKAPMPTADMLFNDVVDLDYLGSNNNDFMNMNDHAHQAAMNELGPSPWDMDQSELFGGVDLSSAGDWKDDILRHQGFGDTA